MPRRGWDAWNSYPESVPLPADGGLSTSKQRGPMASTWWSRRFTEVLESYGLGGRMQRGRRYARTGQVLGLEVRTAKITARVQGSRRTPYLVTISLPEPTPRQWRSIEAAMAAKVGFVARLLAGEIPPDLEGVFRSAGVALFPDSWRGVESDCTCPDWENPCKHIAAVLYVFADQLDADPWLILAWRGRTRDQILGHLRAPKRPAVAEIAPWWPFAPGPLPNFSPGGHQLDADAHPPDRADEVLNVLEPLRVRLGTEELVEALRRVYPSIVTQDVAGELDS